MSLAGRGPGTYYLRVLGYNGAANPRYGLVVLAPESATGDPAEGNDTRATATDLGTVNGVRTGGYSIQS